MSRGDPAGDICLQANDFRHDYGRLVSIFSETVSYGIKLTSAGDPHPSSIDPWLRGA
jgi:hypothetical protein